MDRKEALLWLAKYKKGKVSANAIILASLLALGLIAAGPGGFNIISSAGGGFIEVSE